jgi:hypothetical protein
MGIYDRNDGQAGVVYILVNEALKDGIYKIGQSTRSGRARASELNSEGKTGMPKLYRCVYEVRTIDCGRAEKMVHARLHKARLTKQEFFRVDLEDAKRAINEVVAHIDSRPVQEVKPVRQYGSLDEAKTALLRSFEPARREHQRKDTIWMMCVMIPIASLFVAVLCGSVLRKEANQILHIFFWFCIPLEGIAAWNLFKLNRMCDDEANSENT